MYFKQTIFLGCKILQLFCGYGMWHMYFIIVAVVVCTFSVMLLSFFSESIKLLGCIWNTIISFLTLISSLVLYFPVVGCKIRVCISSMEFSYY